MACRKLDFAAADIAHVPSSRLGCQGRQELVGGIGRGTELERDLDPQRARSLLTSPDGLLDLKIDFVDELCK